MSHRLVDEDGHQSKRPRLSEEGRAGPVIPSRFARMAEDDDDDDEPAAERMQLSDDDDDVVDASGDRAAGPVVVPFEMPAAEPAEPAQPLVPPPPPFESQTTVIELSDDAPMDCCDEHHNFERADTVLLGPEDTQPPTDPPMPEYDVDPQAKVS